MKNVVFFVFILGTIKLAYANEYLIASISKDNNDYRKFNNIMLIGGENNSDQIDLLKPKKIEFGLIVVGSRVKPTKINSLSSYYGLRSSDKEVIYNYLLSVGVESSMASYTSDKIDNGIVHDLECLGERDTCIINNVTTPRFVVDYYNSTLRVFIPPKNFKQEKKQREFLSKEKLHNQLVSNLYVNYDHSYDDSYFIQTKNYLGLGDGYVIGRTNNNQSDNSIEQLEYIYNHNEYSYFAGKSKNSEVYSDIFDGSPLIDKDFFGLGFARTNNLYMSSSSERSLFFFSPTSGIMEVRRGEDIVYQSYINSGRNIIPYTLLPQGSYSVNISVKNGDVTTLSQDDFVFNVNTNIVKQFSPYLRAGELSLGEKKFFAFESGAILPLSNTFSVSANSNIVDNEAFFTSSLSYKNQDLFTSLSYSFGSEQMKTKLNINYKSLSFQLSKQENAIKDNLSFNSIDSLLSNYDNIAASLTAYRRVNDALYLSASALYNKYERYENHNYSYNLDVNYTIFNDTTINVGFTSSTSNQQLTLGINIPITTNERYSQSISNNSTYSSEKLFNNTTSFQHNHKFSSQDSLSFRGTGNYNNDGIKNENDHYGGMSVVYTKNNKFINSSIRLSKVDARESYGANLTTTQIINKHGIFYTRDQGLSSSIYINSPDVRKVKIGEAKLRLNDTHNRPIILSDGKIIHQPGYSFGVFNFTQNAEGIHVKNNAQYENRKISFIPGKYETINFSAVTSGQLLVISQSDSDDTRCVGSACLEKTKIQDGVYQFSLKSDSNVLIINKNSICWSGNLAKSTTKAIICE